MISKDRPSIWIMNEKLREKYKAFHNEMLLQEENYKQEDIIDQVANIEYVEYMDIDLENIHRELRIHYLDKECKPRYIVKYDVVKFVRWLSEQF